ncbi:hypothetical protein AB5J62_22410 [Amycolatopsis sp. cg5]|uniref:hypothetical protein n=1 Tax=Amycolatopsis sp. cg5 TaxID=3238802 RepID=UPI0035261066
MGNAPSLSESYYRKVMTCRNNWRATPYDKQSIEAVDECIKEIRQFWTKIVFLPGERERLRDALNGLEEELRKHKEAAAKMSPEDTVAAVAAGSPDEMYPEIGHAEFRRAAKILYDLAQSRGGLVTPANDADLSTVKQTVTAVFTGSAGQMTDHHQEIVKGIPDFVEAAYGKGYDVFDTGLHQALADAGRAYVQAFNLTTIGVHADQAMPGMGFIDTEKYPQLKKPAPQRKDGAT